MIFSLLFILSKQILLNSLQFNKVEFVGRICITCCSLAREFLGGGGGGSHMDKTGILIRNFELNL